MTEVWKDIEGYEGKYQVSNLGNVKSLNYRGHGYAKVLTPKVNNSGRLWVELSDNWKRRQFLIHRLVGNAFIPNPHNLPEINHIDENPKNNAVENLEWCTRMYNVHYFLDRHRDKCRTRKTPSRRNRRIDKRICQIDMDGNTIKTWTDASTIKNETGYSQWSITQCCDGKRKTAYGFRWQYAI